MKALGGGGGSYSSTSKKYEPKAEPKKPKPVQGLSHSQLMAQWEANGRDPKTGKLIKHVPHFLEVLQQVLHAPGIKHASPSPLPPSPPPPPITIITTIHHHHHHHRHHHHHHHMHTITTIA